MKQFFKNNIVILWAFLSIVFAIVVHICFKTEITIEWLRVKWTAGDILIYSSTVALGLLAVWQNKKIREESEANQSRLQKIATDANELNAVQRIIDVESKRLERLRKVLDEFAFICNPQAIGVALFEADGFNRNLTKNLTEIERKVDESYIQVKRELRIDCDREPSIKMKLDNCYYKMKDLLKRMKTNPEGNNYEEDAKEMGKLRDDFWNEKEDYIGSEEKKLYSVIYGELSLEEVKELYDNSK